MSSRSWLSLLRKIRKENLFIQTQVASFSAKNFILNGWIFFICRCCSVRSDCENRDAARCVCWCWCESGLVWHWRRHRTPAASSTSQGWDCQTGSRTRPLLNLSYQFGNTHQGGGQFGQEKLEAKMVPWFYRSGRFGPKDRVSWNLSNFESLVSLITGIFRHFFFPCQRWLGASTDEGQVSWTLVPIPRELVIAKVNSEEPTAIREALRLELKSLVTTYTIHVFTGNKSGSGTDADVYIILHGDMDSSEAFWLSKSQTNKNKFENGMCDIFEVEAKNLGEIQTIT